MEFLGNAPAASFRRSRAGALAGFVHIKHRLGLIAGDIYADFPHSFDDDRIEFAGFKAGTLSFEVFTTNFIQKGLGHLATGTVVNTNEQHLFLHKVWNLARC